MEQRKTLQRQTILLAIKASRGFLSAEEIFRRVSRKCKGIGLSTVYRNLDTMVKQGAIFSFEDHDGVRRYAGFAFHDSFFSCEQCSARVDVPLRKFEEQLSVALPGRSIFFSRLEVRGLCKKCSSKRQRVISQIL